MEHGRVSILEPAVLPFHDICCLALISHYYKAFSVHFEFYILHNMIIYIHEGLVCQLKDFCMNLDDLITHEKKCCITSDSIVYFVYATYFSEKYYRNLLESITFILLMLYFISTYSNRASLSTQSTDLERRS